ncbi:MAG: lipoate--protein ligase family protein [Actinobacteria bacterium]|nr:lipoate--protein ligase family protein [Actinomycetota bacterium]
MPTRRRVQLVGGTYEPWPSYDTALTRALLLRVSSGDAPETMRLYQPQATVWFSRHDRQRPGFASASLRARAAGFAVGERLAGSVTVAAHDGCVMFDHCVPDQQPQRHETQRFVESSAIVAACLRGIGIDARIGEIEGEPSPGPYSVNARGAVKLATLGYRSVAGASLISGILVVRNSEQLRDVLIEVNDALGIDWDPRTLGSIEDEIGEADTAAVGDALVEEIESRMVAVEGSFEDGSLALATALQPEHVDPDDAGEAGRM